MATKRPKRRRKRDFQAGSTFIIVAWSFPDRLSHDPIGYQECLQTHSQVKRVAKNYLLLIRVRAHTNTNLNSHVYFYAAMMQLWFKISFCSMSNNIPFLQERTCDWNWLNMLIWLPSGNHVAWRIQSTLVRRRSRETFWVSVTYYHGRRVPTLADSFLCLGGGIMKRHNLISISTNTDMAALANWEILAA